MSDIAEGIGGAIEGALTGRAVEPKNGEGNAESAPLPPEECANCGAITTSAYCPQCGQKREVHRSLRAIGHDLIHGVLHLDGKFWLTLPLLILKPGKLTRRYIEGERAKFVSPMAMFLFSVFAMFAVFQVVGLSAPSSLGSDIDLNAATETMRAETEESRAKLAGKLEEMSADDPAREETEAELEQFDRSLEGLAEVEKLTFSDNSGINISSTGFAALDEGLLKKWKENPGLMIYKLQSNAYKFSWLLIPLSIPFVWLIFVWKRRFKAYDHAIFVTYSLAFMSLLFIVVSVLMTVETLGWLGGLLLTFVPPIHIYKQLRGTYEIGRFSAIWRLLFLSVFIWVVIALFLQTLLLLGAF